MPYEARTGHAGYDVVRQQVSAGAVSRLLKTSFQRAEKFDFGKPGTLSGSTAGFKVHAKDYLRVEVRWHADSLAPWEEMIGVLSDAGYEAAVATIHPDTVNETQALHVIRWRQPWHSHWAALESVADHPVDCDPFGVTEDIIADDVTVLVRSGLLQLLRYPKARRSKFDDARGYLLALTEAGGLLLERHRRDEDGNRE